MKKCNKCNTWKSKKNFHLYKITDDGYHRDCKDCICKRMKQNYQKNKARYDARDANKRSYRSKASPNWLNRELEDFIFGEMRSYCRDLEKLTNVKHHVDHIIPLMGNKICGFHESKNWQILTAKENLSKSNKWEE